MFCHIYPLKFLKEYNKTQLPQLLKFLDANASPEAAYMVDDDARIKYMDRHKIDIEVLTLAFQNAIETLKDNELLRITKIANDSIAEVVQKHSDRMMGIAMLPKLTDEYLDELDRSIKELGMRGCVIFTNVLGKPVDSPEFIQFFERMNSYDLPVLIHPTNWPYYPWVREYRLGQIFGWPFDTSLAMGRIVFGGIFQRFPNLKIITHHLGGMLPFYGERVRDFFDEAVLQPDVYGANLFPFVDQMNQQSRHPLDDFKKFYGDTVVYGNLPSLKCGLDFFGSQHVVFATDYPFGTMKGERLTNLITESIMKVDITEEERQDIFENNARRILNFK